VRRRSTSEVPPPTATQPVCRTEEFADPFPASGPCRLEFTVAAFQPGVNPNDAFNGAGQIAPVTPPIATDTRGTKGTYQ